MSIAADLKILYHLTVAPIRGGTHAERLESFYSGQADGYDSFRARLLKGREETYRAIPAEPGAVWIDLGGGTGSNLECLGERISRLGKVYLVDLSPSLLAKARQRISDRGWRNVETVAADATTFVPAEGQADIVTFSYSLTMIPDWFAALEQARRLLRPGGTIGVVDFYVSRKHAETSRRRHGWFTRTFWPAWFARDNVFLSPDHVPYLHRAFDCLEFAEETARVPYLPWPRVPYYRFVGRKRAN
jgi:S-adenosylmethionine-diacylgycerolhomoserine-N-methlytransferase